MFPSQPNTLISYSHSTGKNSEVLGELSARTSWNTEKASRTVMPANRERDIERDVERHMTIGT